VTTLPQPTLWVLAQSAMPAAQIREIAAPWPVGWIDGANAPSFSWLVNQAIAQTSGEVVLVTSDRCRPTAADCQRMLDLLAEGYGFVGLWRFACFAIAMDLLRRIGPMDERFPGGGYEDADFLLRCCEADIAIFETEAVAYLGGGQSRWASLAEGSMRHFRAKWAANMGTGTIVRQLPEDASWNYGLDRETVFKRWKDSVLLQPSEWTRFVRPTSEV